MNEECLFQFVAQRLKTLRTEKGITQEGVYLDTRIHIGRIEQGKTNISLKTLHKICGYFKVSLAEFFHPFENNEDPVAPLPEKPEYVNEETTGVADRSVNL